MPIYKPEGEADTSVFPLGGSHVQPIGTRQPLTFEERIYARLEALEAENAALKLRVAELEEWRDGLDLPDQPEDGPARPILPPYEG